MYAKCVACFNIKGRNFLSSGGGRGGGLKRRACLLTVVNFNVILLDYFLKSFPPPSLIYSLTNCVYIPIFRTCRPEDTEYRDGQVEDHSGEHDEGDGRVEDGGEQDERDQDEPVQIGK